MFSVAGIVVDKRRCALTPAMIDALVFLNKNSPLLLDYGQESPARGAPKLMLLPANNAVSESDLSDDEPQQPSAENPL